MRVPLIDGQGNFGSVDGDPPAAMRYTEARRAKVAHSMTEDIDKDTVDFRDNYDGSEREPVVLPARFPNLLVNGGGGIAVGMATNIPPHNLGEVIDGTMALIDDPTLTTEQLMEFIPGPDFPTGGIILGRGGIRSAYETGRGSIVMRGQVTVETVQARARGARRPRDPLPGQQGDDDREDRRDGARQAHRRHRRHPRRERPRRHARRDRAEARRRGRRGAQPALALLRPADLLRRQLRRAERRPAGDDEAQGRARRLRRLPRGGGDPAHQVSALQGPRPRPCAGRAGDRGGAYRRGDPRHPPGQGSRIPRARN